MTRFYCRFPTWPFWIVVFVLAAGAVRSSLDFIHSGGAFEGIARSYAIITIGFAFAIVFFGLILRKIVRVPVVEISDDSILHGSVMAAFLPRRRIRLDQVAEIISSSSESIELRMRSGRRARIHLDEVRKAQRQEAQNAIEARLASP